MLCPADRRNPLCEEAQELAGDFKALADPVRLRLLSLIASVPEEKSAPVISMSH